MLNPKYFVNGFNRTGSTLLFEILKNISTIESNIISHSESEKKYLEKYSNLINILDCQFKLNKNYSSAQASPQFNSLDYYCACKNEFIYMGGLPINRFLFDSIHRTYSKLDLNIVNTAKEFQRLTFCPIRNPLDVIVSNAFEVENLLLWMYPDDINTTTFSDVRKAYGATFLKNLDWFENIASLIKKYNEAHIRYKDKTHWVKYEDIIDNPIDNIINIGSIAGINLDKKIATSIWEKVGFKPLTNWKSHYFEPGHGKWKKYLSHNHLKILIDDNWQASLDKLGYEIDLVSCLAEDDIANFHDIKDEKNISNYASIRDACFSLQFGKKIQFKNENIKILSSNIGGHIINCTTNSENFAHLFKTLSNNDLLDNFTN